MTPASILFLPAVEHDTAAAQAVFDGMAGDGVAPSRLLQNALLAAYAAAGDLEVGLAPMAAFSVASLDSFMH